MAIGGMTDQVLPALQGRLMRLGERTQHTDRANSSILQRRDLLTVPRLEALYRYS